MIIVYGILLSLIGLFVYACYQCYYEETYGFTKFGYEEYIRNHPELPLMPYSLGEQLIGLGATVKKTTHRDNWYERFNDRYVFEICEQKYDHGEKFLPKTFEDYKKFTKLANNQKKLGNTRKQCQKTTELMDYCRQIINNSEKEMQELIDKTVREIGNG